MQEAGYYSHSLTSRPNVCLPLLPLQPVSQHTDKARQTNIVYQSIKLKFREEAKNSTTFTPSWLVDAIAARRLVRPSRRARSLVGSCKVARFIRSESSERARKSNHADRAVALSLQLACGAETARSRRRRKETPRPKAIVFILINDL